MTSAIRTTGETFKWAARASLARLGLLRTARLLRVFLRYGARGVRDYRLGEAKPRRVAEFISRYADSFAQAGTEPLPDAPRVLVIGASAPNRIEIVLCLVKALELKGWLPVRLETDRSEAFLKEISPYYSLLSSFAVCNRGDQFDPAAFREEAEKTLCSVRTMAELLELKDGAVRTGGHAIATARRRLGIGRLDLENKAVRRTLIDCIAASKAATAAAERAVRELGPSLVLAEDTAYTPQGEILDICTHLGVPVIRWYTAHKASALMLKRYVSANREHDINSLSDESWRIVREMKWNANRSEQVKRELTAGYANKDWYSEDGAQFNKRQLDVAEVRNKLGLDPRKKTAIIFPHIAYDASFGRGEDLFESYDEWLAETVLAACANQSLQWVVRVHPAHAGKRHGNGQRMPDEEDTLRRLFGRLPKHVSLIPARSDISTLSLFAVMDYCLTVRGTVGLEAACRGIPVVTGGAGRYDRKGFTIDSATSDEYLERLAGIQDIPRLSPAQVEMAERFAYGLFLLRPLPLSSVALSYDKALSVENLFNPVEIKPKTRKDWETAPDLKAFVEWATGSDSEDFLLPDSPYADELQGHAP